MDVRRICRPALAALALLIAVCPALTPLRAVATGEEEGSMETHSGDEVTRLTQAINDSMDSLEDKVAQVLFERYRRAFTVCRTITSPGLDEITQYWCPEDDPTLVFSAQVRKGPVVRDDYVARLRAREFEQSLVASLEALGCDSAANAVLPRCDTTGDDPSTTLSQLLGREGSIGMLVRVALRAPVPDPDGVAQALCDAGLACGASVVFNGYVLGDEGFEACRRQFMAVPSTSHDIITAFDPVAQFELVTENGACDVVSQQGIAMTGGEKHAE